MKKYRQMQIGNSKQDSQQQYKLHFSFLKIKRRRHKCKGELVCKNVRLSVIVSQRFPFRLNFIEGRVTIALSRTGGTGGIRVRLGSQLQKLVNGISDSHSLAYFAIERPRTAAAATCTVSHAILQPQSANVSSCLHLNLKNHPA